MSQEHFSASGLPLASAPMAEFSLRFKKLKDGEVEKIRNLEVKKIKDGKNGVRLKKNHIYPPASFVL